MKTYLLKPYGYCYGVSNAIKMAEKVKLDNRDKNVYIFGMLVHNNVVCNYLNQLGIITIDTSNINKEERLKQFTPDDIVIFTAHGHDEKYDEILKEKGIQFYNSTCKIVQRNMDLIKKYLSTGDVIYIGKNNHPETEASLSISSHIALYDIKTGMDYSKIKSDEIHVVNQTTLSILEISQIHDDIKNHFPNAIIEDEICSSTRIRQEAIKKVKEPIDLFIIIGSVKSSNTDKLYQIAKETFPKIDVIKVETLDDLKKYDLSKYQYACLTSGTSTPIISIEEIEAYVKGI